MTGGFPTVGCRMLLCSECSEWRTFAPTGDIPVKSAGHWRRSYYCGRCWTIQSTYCDPPSSERTPDEIRDDIDRQEILAGFNAARDGDDTPDGAGRLWLMGFWEYVRLQVKERANAAAVYERMNG